MLSSSLVLFIMFEKGEKVVYERTVPIGPPERIDLTIEHFDLNGEHKLLINMLTSLKEIIQSLAFGTGNEEFAENLNILNLYTIVHFGTEERLMSDLRSGYVVDTHVKQHHVKQHKDFTHEVDNFIKKFHNIREGLAENKSIELQDLAKEIFEYMENWLVNHIQNKDRPLFAKLLG